MRKSHHADAADDSRCRSSSIWGSNRRNNGGDSVSSSDMTVVCGVRRKRLAAMFTLQQRPKWFVVKRCRCELGGPTPKSPFSVGAPGPLSKAMLLRTTRVSLPNGISFCTAALAGCTSVKEDIHTCRHTDHATVTRVAISGITLKPHSVTATDGQTVFLQQRKYHRHPKVLLEEISSVCRNSQWGFILPLPSPLLPIPFPFLPLPPFLSPF